MAIKLIIGLGNKGEEYEKTYHNAGFLAVDAFGELAAKDGAEFKFFKPAGYMNVMGELVKAALRKEKVSPESCLIAHDDSDLLLGEFKLSFGQGSAGHKGVQNIIDQLGSEGFWRLRIGIRDPKEKIRKKAEEFVLKKISAADSNLLAQAFEEAWPKIKEIS